MKCIALLLSLVLAGAAFHASADEVEDALTAALKAWQQKQAKEALAAMDTARKLIEEKTSASVAAALPKELGEWTRSKVEVQSLSDLGGTATTCSYKKGDKAKGLEKKVTVSISAGSQLLAQISTFIKAPALGKLLGATPKSVNGTPGMWIEKEGILQFAVDERFVVVVQGKKVSEADLAAVAAGVKQDVLKGLK